MSNNTWQSGRLFVISGPSGTGKGTICKRIIAETDAELSVSATTRNPREGEKDGVSYFFLSKEKFREEIDAGGFLEYAEVFENYYGTPLKPVEKQLAQGKDVILEIDVQGALKVKEKCPDGILIFILPPSLQVLRERLTGRGTETEDVINLRLSKASREISCGAHKYDYAVVNGDLDRAVEDVKSIIRAEHLRVPEDAGTLLNKYKEEI